MGPRVNGSNGSMGQWLTFTILYMIADFARLPPPRCKKHTAYHDTRLTPHRCKKHTASFARSTGKFPSKCNSTFVIYSHQLLQIFVCCPCCLHICSLFSPTDKLYPSNATLVHILSSFNNFTEHLLLTFVSVHYIIV